MAKRIAFTDISYVMLEQWLKNPIRHHDVVWQTNLPKDATVVRVTDGGKPSDPLGVRQVIRIYWESAEFAEAPEGTYYPEFPIVATTSLFWASNGVTK